MHNYNWKQEPRTTMCNAKCALSKFLLSLLSRSSNIWLINHFLKNILAFYLQFNLIRQGFINLQKINLTIVWQPHLQHVKYSKIDISTYFNFAFNVNIKINTIWSFPTQYRVILINQSISVSSQTQIFWKSQF